MTVPVSILPVRAEGKPKIRELRGVMKNASRCGLYVEAEGQWEVGSSVVCLLGLPAPVFGGRFAPVRFAGKVVRLETHGTRSGLGIEVESLRLLRIRVRATRRARRGCMASVPALGF